MMERKVNKDVLKYFFQHNRGAQAEIARRIKGDYHRGNVSKWISDDPEAFRPVPMSRYPNRQLKF